MRDRRVPEAPVARARAYHRAIAPSLPYQAGEAARSNKSKALKAFARSKGTSRGAMSAQCRRTLEIELVKELLLWSGATGVVVWHRDLFGLVAELLGRCMPLMNPLARAPTKPNKNTKAFTAILINPVDQQFAVNPAHFPINEIVPREDTQFTTFRSSVLTVPERRLSGIVELPAWEKGRIQLNAETHDMSYFGAMLHCFVNDRVAKRAILPFQLRAPKLILDRVSGFFGPVSLGRCPIPHVHRCNLHPYRTISNSASRSMARMRRTRVNTTTRKQKATPRATKTGPSLTKATMRRASPVCSSRSRGRCTTSTHTFRTSPAV